MGSVSLNTGMLVIRADASARIGTGHMMRCFALAQAWQLEGGHVVFLSHCESDALQRRITEAGMEFIPIANPHPDPRDLQTTLDILRTRSAGGRENRKSEIGNPTWLVLDGYHFAPIYQQAVRTAGYRLLVIDDMGHLPAYHADILLNQNLSAEKLKYNCDSDATLLLGSRYALLRQEFLAWRGWQRAISNVARKVLVTLGGGDPHNVTLKVIQSLQQINVDGLEAVVVVGASNPHYQEIQQAGRASQVPIRLESNATNMPELMAWADVAVSGGGSSCWELAFMGLPSVMIVLADNQEPISEQLEADGIGINLGRFQKIALNKITRALDGLLADETARSAMSRRGKELVDSEGAARVVRCLLEANVLTLRHAREDDCRLVWQWANDPEARAVSFSAAPIPWERHVQWFASKLADTRCHLLIAMNGDNQLLGQIRFDVEDDQAVVSVSLARWARGKGYGSRLIGLAAQQVFETANVRAIHAYTKPDNTVSVRTFEKAGFKNLGCAQFGEHLAIHLVLEKNELH